MYVQVYIVDPYAPEKGETSHYPILNLLTLPHSFHTAGTTIKALTFILPNNSSLSLVPLHGAPSQLSLAWPFLGSMTKQIIFSMKLSPNLLALPYINNNKIYVLKQFQYPGKGDIVKR